MEDGLDLADSPDFVEVEGGCRIDIRRCRLGGPPRGDMSVNGFSSRITILDVDREVGAGAPSQISDRAYPWTGPGFDFRRIHPGVVYRVDDADLAGPYHPCCLEGHGLTRLRVVDDLPQRLPVGTIVGVFSLGRHRRMILVCDGHPIQLTHLPEVKIGSWAMAVVAGRIPCRPGFLPHIAISEFPPLILLAILNVLVGNSQVVADISHILWFGRLQVKAERQGQGTLSAYGQGTFHRHHITLVRPVQLSLKISPIPADSMRVDLDGRRSLDMGVDSGGFHRLAGLLGI